MSIFLKTLAVALAVAALPVAAGEMSVETQARLLKVLVANAGGGKVSCSDAALKAALEAQGVGVDPAGAVLWATSPGEARMGKMSGRLVVAARRELAASAAILLQEEDGRPRIILNVANLKAARAQVSDAIYKLGEKI